MLTGDLARPDQGGFIIGCGRLLGSRGIPAKAPIDDPGRHAHGDRARGDVAEDHAHRPDLRPPADPHAAEHLGVGTRARRRPR